MLALILELIFIFIVIAFTIPFFTSGLGYAPTTKSVVERMIAVSKLKKGEKAVDIGSGDGRIVIALAKVGAEAHGFEINPILVWISRYRIRKAGLSGKAFIHYQSFWKADVSSYDVITLFAVSYIMKGLETKLLKELKPGARVVTNRFMFPNWKSSVMKKGVTLYVKADVIK